MSVDDRLAELGIVLPAEHRRRSPTTSARGAAAICCSSPVTSPSATARSSPARSAMTSTRKPRTSSRASSRIDILGTVRAALGLARRRHVRQDHRLRQQCARVHRAAGGDQRRVGPVRAGARRGARRATLAARSASRSCRSAPRSRSRRSSRSARGRGQTARLTVRPYKQLGEVPRKRHMRFSDNGRMAYEELFGREGFSGPSSLIYHRNLPEGAQDVSEGPADLMTPEHEQVHTNAHLKGFDLPAQGDMITGRRWLLVNDDVHIGLVAPVTAQQVLYVNGSADEMLFVHSGQRHAAQPVRTSRLQAARLHRDSARHHLPHRPRRPHRRADPLHGGHRARRRAGSLPRAQRTAHRDRPVQRARFPRTRLARERREGPRRSGSSARTM